MEPSNRNGGQWPPARPLGQPSRVARGSEIIGQDGAVSAQSTEPRSRPHYPGSPSQSPTLSAAAASPVRPLPNPLLSGASRHNRVASNTGSHHSQVRSHSGSVGSTRSVGSFVGRSFAYGFYNSGIPGTPKPLPSPRAEQDSTLPGGGVIRIVAPSEERLGRSEARFKSEGGPGFDHDVPDMPLGILNTKDGEAPGTVLAAMQDIREKRSSTGLAVAGSMSPEHMLDPRLKYDRTGKEPVLLIPQPADDPNDPLNWPLWRRDSILVVLCFMSVIASTLSPLLAADTFSLAIEFEHNFTDMALLTGYHLLAVGLSGFLFVASARVWGKRHLYLLGCILIIVSSAWGGSVGTNYGSLLGARIVQGIGLAPFEALVNASVADLYFVHERATRMALSNMALFGGAFFTPIIVGKMSYEIGWQWSFWLVAIFSGVCFPFIFFFVPETAYRRDQVSAVALDNPGNPHVATPANGATTEAGQSSLDPEVEKGAASSSSASGRNDSTNPSSKKVSYARSLLPFSGRKTDDAFWKLILRPFPLFLHPAVAWACLIQGVIIGWTVMIGVVLAALFIGPPLWFGEIQTGYMYAGPFVGAIIGFLLSGLIADSAYRLMTRWNGGVYEPEFRIILVVPQLILGCAGLFGFGATANGLSHGWFWPTFCFALEVAGMVMGAVASALYIADAHQDIAVEAFTCLLIFKNVFSFGLTYGAFDWLSLNGTFNVFIILGSVQAGICLLSIPMYIFGKRNRAFFGRHNILKYLGLW